MPIFPDTYRHPVLEDPLLKHLAILPKLGVWPVGQFRIVGKLLDPPTGFDLVVLVLRQPWLSANNLRCWSIDCLGKQAVQLTGAVAAFGRTRTAARNRLATSLVRRSLGDSCRGRVCPIRDTRIRGRQLRSIVRRRACGTRIGSILTTATGQCQKSHQTDDVHTKKGIHGQLSPTDMIQLAGNPRPAGENGLIYSPTHHL